MNFGTTYISKKRLILGALFTLLLIGGLVAGLYLLQQQQTIKSKASSNLINAFEIKDDKGNTLVCDGNTNPPTCTTSSLNINIKVKDLNALTQ